MRKGAEQGHNMIFDKLKNITRYKGINENLDRAIDLILSTDFQAVTEEKTEISEDLYFTKAAVETSDITDSYFEVHKRYADIFIPLSEKEIVKVSSPEGMNLLMEYNEEADCYAVGGPTDISFVNTPETFCVCFPDEGHNSAGSINGKTVTFEKIVVKVKM